MDMQTDARDALRTAQIYRQVEAIFSVGGGMSCGLMMQQYLKLGDTEKALDCLKQMVEAAVGPAMTPNPALFYPTLAPKKSANKRRENCASCFCAVCGGMKPLRICAIRRHIGKRLPGWKRACRKRIENAAKQAEAARRRVVCPPVLCYTVLRKSLA